MPATHISSCAPRRRVGVRSGASPGLLALVIALLAIPAAHAKATDTPLLRPLGGCSLTPTANAISFDVTALLTTVRNFDGAIEVLHDAHCLDGRVGTVWIAGDVI